LEEERAGGMRRKGNRKQIPIQEAIILVHRSQVKSIHAEEDDEKRELLR